MRDGRAVATYPAETATPAQLIRGMVGHDLPAREAASTREHGPVCLRVRGLRAGERVRDVSLELRKGEILGLAGLIGSGRTETLRAIFGADPKTSGEILVDEQPAAIHSPADALRFGIGLVPEDRKQDGLLLPQSIRVNTTLGTMLSHASAIGWINSAAETNTTQTMRARLNVHCAASEQAVGELSGGNQQKVVISRWLVRDCPILLFDEPTRGIDVAAKDTIYQLLRDLARGGKAVLMVSSELEELMLICDRLLVISQGTITAEFSPENWSQEKITQAAFSGYLNPNSKLSHS